jgi:parallel beta-helix repeat protein
MAVLLSPVGGVAAQFFDNDGNVLSGGKIYTYAAGTSTPQTTYTTGAGLVAHSNPIILNSAGRVPTGEIWLTDGSAYKFVIRDANDTLIGSYDNIVGINSNFVNYTASQEIQTATAGQTVFTLTTMAYQPGTNSLSVFVDGVNQYGPGAQYAYTETTSTSITFVSGLHVGASVKFTTAVINNVGGVDASQVTYDPPFTGSVSTNVEAKLAQTVSVKDFGAIGDGVADDFLAINRATKYVADQGGGTVFYPPGTYRITRAIRLDNFDVDTNTYNGQTRENIVHAGAGRDSTIILADGFYACIFTSFPEPFIPSGSVSPSPTPGNVMASNVVIKDMTLDCNYNNVVDGGTAYGPYYATSPQATGGWPNGYVGVSYWAADNYQYPIYFYYSEGLQVTNCRVKNSWYNGIEIYASARVQINDNFVENCGDKANFLGYYSGLQFDQRSNTISATDNIIQNCGNGVMSVSGAGATSAVLDVVVADNVFYNIGPGNGVYATDYVQQWDVTGNVFDTLENQGIVFSNNQPGWPATKLPKDCVIANNIIRDFNLSNGAGTTGIRAIGHNFVISGNHITQTNPAVTANTIGIAVSDGIVTVGTNESKGMSIVGNSIAGKFPSNTATIGMIYVDAENVTVSGNTIKSTASAAQTAISLLSTNSVVTANNIVGTFVQTNRAIYRYSSSSNMFVQDNRFGPVTAFHTTAATGSISGSNNVDFSGLSTTVDIDNRGNYDSANDSFSPDIPGVYRLDSVVRVTAASATTVQTLIQLNNVTTVAVGVQNVGAGEVVTFGLSGFTAMTSSDLARVRVNVASGNYVIEAFTSLSAQFIRQTS